MLSAVWNLRKKLPNSTRKTLRTIANRTGVSSFLPPADEERLKREQEKEAKQESLQEEVAEVEDFAQKLYASQEAMKNLGQPENTIKEITQKDFIKWKTDMEKKGKFWESALKLFLKYRGKLFWTLSLQDAYKATLYDPHGHFNPSFIKPRRGFQYANQLEMKYKPNILTPEYPRDQQFYTPPQGLLQSPVYLPQRPIWTPALPQIGRGKRRILRKASKTRKTRKTRKTYKRRP